MRAESLGWLACPACVGRLDVSGRFSPHWAEDGRNELLEGILECRNCGAEYPVMLGVALLVPEQQRYLWGFWSDIERCSNEGSNGGISPALRSYLGVPSATTGLASPEDPWEQSLDWTTSPYLQAHFDAGSLTEGIPAGWWKDAVNRFHQESFNPYTFLVDSARQLSDRDPTGLAVEVGASVGRTAANLAEDYEFALGSDWSFRAILAARRVLLHESSRLESYPLETEAGDSVPRELPSLERPINLDYVVADGAALPLPSAGATCVAALNVVCAMPQPHRLLSELSRVAAPGALLLFSSPYWSDTQGGSPNTALVLKNPDQTRAALYPGFEMLVEHEMVPWTIRLARRRWNVYLCHCLVARRR